MYSLPSTSQSREPLAFATKNGSPPTLRKARTGEFTPPGINRLASAKRVELVMCESSLTCEDYAKSNRFEHEGSHHRGAEDSKLGMDFLIWRQPDRERRL